MNLVNVIRALLGYQSKRETLNQLRHLPERQLRDCGISPALLNEGVRSWPWMEESDDTITRTPIRTIRVKSSVEKIQSVSDKTHTTLQPHPKAA